MKKLLAMALSAVIMVSLFMTASASFSIKDLDITIPDELKELIDGTKTDELAETVRTKLDEVKNMSDEEIYEMTREFCTKYRVELNDDQVRKVSEYAKKATNFSLQDIKDEIESLKTKASAFKQFMEKLKNAGEKLLGYFASAYSAIQNLIKNLFSAVIVIS